MKSKPTCEEDLFTECFAAALRADSNLMRQFLRELCGSKVGGLIESAAIEVETQADYSDYRSRVDMCFTLSSKRRQVRIGVENKLWSPEGDGQLAKYLRLPLDFLAFITGEPQPVHSKVLQHRKYIKPNNGRKHFMWSDFYGVIEKSTHAPSASVLNGALLHLFSHYGFEPPLPEIGDLNHPDPDEAKKHKKQFAKLWGRTRQCLSNRGWKKLNPGSIAQLYVLEGPPKNAWNGHSSTHLLERVY